MHASLKFESSWLSGVLDGTFLKKDGASHNSCIEIDMSAGDVEFVPFSIEAGGVRGNA